MEKIITTIYKASDGKTFDIEEDCLEYEKEIEQKFDLLKSIIGYDNSDCFNGLKFYKTTCNIDNDFYSALAEFFLNAWVMYIPKDKKETLDSYADELEEREAVMALPFIPSEFWYYSTDDEEGEGWKSYDELYNKYTQKLNEITDIKKTMLSWKK